MLGVVNIIDDILVYGMNRHEHDQRLTELFEHHNQPGVPLNEMKSEFRATSVNFIGVIVDSDGTSPDAANLKAIQDLSPPTNVTRVRRPMGKVIHVVRLTPHLSEVTLP